MFGEQTAQRGCRGKVCCTVERIVIAAANARDRERADGAVSPQQRQGIFNPRRLLGEESRATICSAVELLSGQAVDGISFAISRHKSSACWRAAGKIARILMLFSKHWKKQQIRTAAELPFFSNKEMSPDSLPKQRPSTQPSLSSRETAPAAKSPALPVAKQTGSSITTSAPASSAIRVRVYLSRSAGAPAGQSCRS